MNTTVDLDNSHDDLEAHIRRAIAHEAMSHVPPSDLESRTLDAIHELSEQRSPSWRTRVLGRHRSEGSQALSAASKATRPRWNDKRVPAWMIYGAALPILLALFAGGKFLVNEPNGSSDVSADLYASGSAVTPAGGYVAETGPTASSRSAGAAAEGSAPVAKDSSAVPDPTQNALTADLAVNVKSGEFEQAWGRAHDIAARHQGFVTSSGSSIADKSRYVIGSLTMRVPSANLEAAVSDLRRLGTLDHMDRSQNNLSQPISDFDAKIRTLRTEEEQLLVLLKQTTRVSEVVDIRSRLDNLRDEIGTLEATVGGMRQQVDLATINFTLSDGKSSSVIDDRSKVQRAFDQASDAFTTTLAGTVLAAGYIAPFAIALALVVMVRRFRRRIV